jgi:hypothetical protein
MRCMTSDPVPLLHMIGSSPAMRKMAHGPGWRNWPAKKVQCHPAKARERRLIGGERRAP